MASKAGVEVRLSLLSRQQQSFGGPNGDLYIADDNYNFPRVVRFYRTDWPKEQPVNGYAEKFLTRAKMESLMVEYAEKYLADFSANNKLVEK